MKILITNDDGIYSAGIFALADELSKIAEVTVVAPLSERSGASHSLTVETSLNTKEIYRKGKFFGIGVNGTPVDSAKLGLESIMDGKPDYLFSGINRGANLATNVFYSGTVAAACEGALNGITSCAISLDAFINPDYTAAAKVAAQWLNIMENEDVPKGVLYNLNVPNLPFDEIKGFKPIRQSTAKFLLKYTKRQAPLGFPYYWLDEPGMTKDAGDDDTDIDMVEKGYVSVTPLHFDRTEYKILDTLNKIIKA